MSGQIQPAIMKKRQVAQRMNCSPRTLDKRLPEFEQRGFPRRDPLLDGWPVNKVEKWLENRFNIEDSIAQETRQLLEEFSGKTID